MLVETSYICFNKHIQKNNLSFKVTAKAENIISMLSISGKTFPRHLNAVIDVIEMILWYMISLLIDGNVININS